MYDTYPTVVAGLTQILPTFYELIADEETSVPCITVLERDNSTSDDGDTGTYSNVSYTVKVWAYDLQTAQEKALLVDSKMRTLGFTRTSATDMYNHKSTIICKVITYQGKSYEIFDS